MVKVEVSQNVPNAPGLSYQVILASPSGMRRCSHAKFDRPGGLIPALPTTSSVQSNTPVPVSRKRKNVTPDPELAISAHKLSERKKKRRKNNVTEFELPSTSSGIAALGTKKNSVEGSSSRVPKETASSSVELLATSLFAGDSQPNASSSGKKQKQKSKKQADNSTPQIPENLEAPSEPLPVPETSDPPVSKRNSKKRERPAEDQADTVVPPEPKKKKNKAKSEDASPFQAEALSPSIEVVSGLAYSISITNRTIEYLFWGSTGCDFTPPSLD